MKDGKYIARGLRKARISENEFKSLMRPNGIKNIEDVEESYLERNGQVSFIKTEGENNI